MFSESKPMSSVSPAPLPVAAACFLCIILCLAGAEGRVHPGVNQQQHLWSSRQTRRPHQRFLRLLSQQHGRKLSQFPWTASQCEWPSGGWPPRCQSSYTYLLQRGQHFNRTFYPARATSFLVAGKTMCRRLQEGDCTWPCHFNGEVCSLDSRLQVSVWDCPGSKARQQSFCSRPIHDTRAGCGSLPGCDFVGGECMAGFYANYTGMEQLEFARSYYVDIPRELVGCCKASNFRWQREKFCAVPAEQAHNPQPFCVKKRECRWDSDTQQCVYRPEWLVQLMFENIVDPASRALQVMALECDAITDRDLCNNYKPVVVDDDQVRAYLSQDLDVVNLPVATSKCKPQPLPRPPPPPPPPPLPSLSNNSRGGPAAA